MTLWSSKVMFRLSEEVKMRRLGMRYDLSSFSLEKKDLGEAWSRRMGRKCRAGRYDGPWWMLTMENSLVEMTVRCWFYTRRGYIHDANAKTRDHVSKARGIFHTWVVH